MEVDSTAQADASAPSYGDGGGGSSSSNSRASGGHVITVLAALTGSELCRVACRPDASVAELKRAVIEQIGGDTAVHLLAHGRPLRGTESLAAAGVSATSCVSLLKVPYPRVLTASADGTARVWRLSPQGPKLLQVLEDGTPLTRAAFSPDGQTVLTASRGSPCAKLWCTSSGECLQTLSGHSDGVTSVAFNQEGELCAIGAGDGIVRLWSLASGELRESYDGHSSQSITDVAFSQDGAWLASAGVDRFVRLWSVADGKVIRELKRQRHRVCSVRLSSDNCMVLTAGGDNSVRLWWAETGECMVVMSHTLHREECRGILCANFGLNNRAIVSTCSDGSVRVWSPVGWQCSQQMSLHSACRAVGFTPDGKSVFCATDDQLGMWKISSGDFELQTSFSVPSSAHGRSSLAVHPQGACVVAPDGDKSAKIWKAPDGTCLQTLLGHDAAILAVAFSPDGSRVATASMDSTARLWHPVAGTCLNILQGHRGAVLSVAFNCKDGELVATASSAGEVWIWDSESGDLLQELPNHEACALAFNPSVPDAIATAASDGIVRLWHCEDAGCVQVMRGHRACVRSIAYGLESNAIVTASDDCTAKLWSAAGGHCLRTLRGHAGAVRAAAFSPVARLVVTASEDGCVKLWAAVTWEQVQTIVPTTGRALCSVFSPNSQAILTSCSDGAVRLYSLDTGRTLCSFRGHKKAVSCVQFFSS